MEKREKLCTFKVADLHFGIEVSRVQEVIRHQEMTRVPLAPDVVTGMMNLRGQIVTALSLRKRFGLPDPTDGRSPMNVVVRTQEGAVSLLVDEIGDVLELEKDAFEPPPEIVQGIQRGFIEGVYKLEGHLLIRLDLQATVSSHAFEHVEV